MGNRTKQINLIQEKKNQIVRAYSELGKNNSSCFDALAVSYGPKNLAKIVAKFGLEQNKIQNNVDETKFSKQVAINMANKIYNADFVEMDLFSSNFIVENSKIKQQMYICIANKNKIDRKRKFDFETLLKNIDKNDILLLDVKEREITPTMSLILQKIDKKEYENQVLSLILKSTPSIESLGKKQTAIVMQELKKNNPLMHNNIIDLQKSVAKNLFLYETTKEQLLLNQAIEEFQTNIFDLSIEEVKNNHNEINQFKTKAEQIEKLMNKNNFILSKVAYDDNKQEEKVF